jgi:hypothetical protein
MAFMSDEISANCSNIPTRNRAFMSTAMSNGEIGFSYEETTSDHYSDVSAEVLIQHSAMSFASNSQRRTMT